MLSDDLHCDSVSVDVQTGGQQYGKDVQASWRPRDGGRVVKWHFECKSHRTRALPADEVAAKLIEAARSSHEIDAWCLVCAHVEPTATLDEQLAFADRKLGLPFGVTVLTPRRNAIRELFACHPDLYEQVYAAPPEPLAPFARQAKLARFRALLEDAARRAAARRQSTGAWTLVAPEAVALLPDAHANALAFLRGLDRASWEAVAYGWAVDRLPSHPGLAGRVLAAPAGIGWTWITGPSGEGKSTVLRQLAWTLGGRDDVHVLFAEAPPGAAVEPPVAWLRGLPRGRRVVLCVDGTNGLSKLGTLLSLRQEIVLAESAVHVVLADRGHARTEASRILPPAGVNAVPLLPLNEREVAELVQALEDRGLLHGSPTEAASRLNAIHRTTDRSWLLPVLMSLTDPDGRGFETILESVLMELLQVDGTALRVLLATSLTHAAGFSLPEELAEGLVGKSRLTAVRSTLAQELERRLLSGAQSTSPGLHYRILTHHPVLADGWIRCALTNEALRPFVTESARTVAAATEATTEAWGLISLRSAQLLRGIVAYLSATEAWDAAAELLEAWLAFDRDRFPNLHQLGECYTSWVQHERKRKPVDHERVRVLADYARDAYRRAFATAERVLSDGSTCPPPLQHFDLAIERRYCAQGLSVLESTLGIDERPLAWRSVLLNLMCFSSSDHRQTARALSTLALTLLRLQHFEDAAVVNAIFHALTPRDPNVFVQRKELERLGYQIPRNAMNLLDDTLSDLLEHPELPSLEDLPLDGPLPLLRAMLSESLDGASALLTSPRRLCAILEQLRAASAEDDLEAG